MKESVQIKLDSELKQLADAHRLSLLDKPSRSAWIARLIVEELKRQEEK